MKNSLDKKLILLVAVAFFAVTCSEDFLSIRPLGSIDRETLKSKTGIELIVTGAYSLINPPLYSWGRDPNNWTFGSICGGDAYKGSEAGDQPPINELERYETRANNDYLMDKWGTNYDGIRRCNDGIVIVEETPLGGEVTDEWKAMKTGELRFLRGFYYFELAKVFSAKLPYLDEQVIKDNINNPIVANDAEIWDKIEADFSYAAENLPSNWTSYGGGAGRANSWAAKAYLAKVKMFQRKFAEALPILQDVIAHGETANGQKYDLEDHFEYNFDLDHDNGKESVFAIQNNINDGTRIHGNPGHSLNYPYGSSAPGGCCGFFQPSYSLVNSYKVDVNGLPFLDSIVFQVDLKNDEGLESSDPFTPDNTTPLDPRLDWTVGRRGIPYLDWGLHPGKDWIRDQQYGGPYSPKKNVYRKKDADAGMTELQDWWAPGSATNTGLMRFADVLLLAAECQAETNSGDLGLAYVNKVRERASHSVVKFDDGTPAANYQIGLYPSFPDKTYALKAIRYERKLELAMEGHRFFDLVRWGTAQTELNAYINKEKKKRQQFVGASFDVPCDLYFPIPTTQLELAGGVIKQINEGAGCAY
ncbi:MAG: RagB/SusD family nutrient uptake outer membrane protein [Bacteroidales bacterium]